MSERILILGGTKEAAILAKQLTDSGKDVTTSLAGRTKEPNPLAGKIRVGGFGGVDGLANWITKNSIDSVVDATHPFATQISRNVHAACEITGTPLSLKKRAPWQKQTGDIWVEVDDLTAAQSAIPGNSSVLLALGSQHISPFSQRNDVHFTIRMIDPPQSSLEFSRHTVVIGKPSKDWKMEAKLMQNHHIDHVLCRNSGGEGAYAKIRAARELAIPVILVKMPS